MMRTNFHLVVNIKGFKRMTVAFMVLLTAICLAQPPKQNLNIVFIGNSITYGARLSNPATEAPPVAAVAYLMRQVGVGEVAWSNQGKSGATTVDFLPSASGLFGKVEKAVRNFAHQHALLIFSVKLGTNDSAIQGPNGAPVSPEAYRQNLKLIADSLLSEFPGCIVIFQQPIWYSPNTYNHSKYLKEGLLRLQTYFPQIEQLVESYEVTHPKRVFRGDKKGFKYFRKHYLTDLQAEQGQQGTFYLHPNKKGAAVLGELWSRSIYKILRKANRLPQ
jgi:lysophospholipase L1-like esterase